MVISLLLFSSILLAEDHALSPTQRTSSSIEDSGFKGATDIYVKETDGPGALCQSTLVAKNRLEAHSSLCRVAFLTAAHCVDTPFPSIEFSGLGEIKANELYLCVPPIYKRKRALFWKPHSSTPGDLATLVFEIPCDKIESKEPSLLAPVDKDGITEIQTNHVHLQKRESSVPGNPGGGIRVQADVKESSGPLFNFHVPSPQGVSVVAGDSGGPVYDDKGRLICPIVSSTYEYLRQAEKLKFPEPDGKSQEAVDPFEVSCDKKAIGKLKTYLALFGLSSKKEDLASPIGNLSGQLDCRQR